MNNPSQEKSPIRLDLIPNDMLTPEDLVAFTGYEEPAKQKQVLSDNNIRFFVVRNNEVRTTWYHINNPIDLRQCSCQTPGYGRWHQTAGPKSDHFPSPDLESVDDKLQAFK